jgi:hypothetical protein
MSGQIKTLIGILSFLLFLLLVGGKVYLNAQHEYQKGEIALKNKDYKQAITSFNRSIHWYTPGSKPVKNSIHALWEIGIQAEQRGDQALALEAFQVLSSSLYSLRSFYLPYSEWISKCEERIAMIRTFQEEKRNPNPKLTREKQKEEIRKILRMHTGPDVVWSIMVTIGFLGWIGSTIGLILQAFRGEKRTKIKPTLFWVILIITFYSLWIISMLRA